MIKLTKVLDMLGDQTVTIFEGEKKLYYGVADKCTKDTWGHAYVTKMDWNNYHERYFINIRYM